MQNIILHQNYAKVKEKWEDKKQMNTKVYKKLIRLTNTQGIRTNKAYIKKRAENIKHCAEFMEVSTCPKCGETEITRASLCRDRLCPLCAWRLAIKRAHEMYDVLNYIADNKSNIHFNFTTLTQENVAGDQLKGELLKISNAWRRVNAIQRTNPFFYGSARVIEITYNYKSATFHPHIHVLECWDNTDCWDTDEWRRQWKRALRLKYNPICDTRRIRGKDGRTENLSAVLEAFKYTTKTSDILKMRIPDINDYIFAIKGKRLVSYNGIFKDTREALKMEDDTKIEDIDEMARNCKECDTTLLKTALKWSFDKNAYITLMLNKKEEFEKSAGF